MRVVISDWASGGKGDDRLSREVIPERHAGSPLFAVSCIPASRNLAGKRRSAIVDSRRHLARPGPNSLSNIIRSISSIPSSGCSSGVRQSFTATPPRDSRRQVQGNNFQHRPTQAAPANAISRNRNIVRVPVRVRGRRIRLHRQLRSSIASNRMPSHQP
jgi:hypothetical protein